MSILSKSQIIGYRNKTRYFSKSINDSLSEFRSESRFDKVTIFLSHKHGETEQLDGAISFLKNFGVEIYVDWLDEGMPEETSGETATRIKKKIKENRKFILLATEDAIKSKWCNWELGLGDAAKYIEHIALLPVKADYSAYKGSEYLQIYPYIYESNSTPNSFFVHFPNNTVTGLGNWLKS